MTREDLEAELDELATDLDDGSFEVLVETARDLVTVRREWLASLAARRAEITRRRSAEITRRRRTTL